MRPFPKTTLLIPTYNWPEALRILLETAMEQIRPPDEIVVADDGSGPETAELIREFAQKSSVPILHAWQPDDGFRLARSYNNGIAAASGDYIVCVNGDCFLDRHFIRDHLVFAQKNQFVGGTRVNIKPDRRDAILAGGNRHITPFSRGISKRLNAIRCRFLAALRPKGGWMIGVNFAVWREDMIRINGFDEWHRGYGGDDLDLFLRLDHADVLRKKMGHYGIVYHFAHPLASREHRERIFKRLDETRVSRKIRCEEGLDRALRERESLAVVHGEIVRFS